MYDLRRFNRHPAVVILASIAALFVVAAAATRSCQWEDDVPAPEPVLDAGVSRDSDAGGIPRGDAGADAAEPARDAGIPFAVAWPVAPQIERHVDASDREAIQAAVAAPGTHVRISGSHGGALVIAASDTALELADGAQLERVFIAQGVRRVSIRGGEVASIELAPPMGFLDPEPRVIDELWVRDVLIENVRMRAPDVAIVVRGRRIAIVGVQARAEGYCVWVGDTMGVPSEDITIARSQLDSAGPEATVRMHDVVRAIVVDNRLSNTLKHNVRVHGGSDMVFIGRNVLLGTGAMMANQPGDHLERIWFVGNTLYQRREGSLVVEPAHLAALVAIENVVYTNEFSEFEHGYGAVAARWRVEANRVLPFVEPPIP